jgi:environmental stress-induced protein Ves
VVSWRNGLGTTRELVRVPDDDDWTWRLSVASSDGPAPFSTYDGVDRELLLLTGEGLELRFDDGVTTLTAHQSHRFAGEAPVLGVPLGGATEQLNLMWRRDVLQAELVLGARSTGLTIAGLGIEVGVRLMPVDAPGQPSPVMKHGR